MAKQKQYLVDQTIEFKDGKGVKQVILRSDTPQVLPAAIAKEALDLGLIREVGKVTDVTVPDEDGDENGGVDGVSGDDVSGD